MSEDGNPGNQTAAEADYEKKFNRIGKKAPDSKDLKNKEAEGDASWKTAASKKTESGQQAPKKKGMFSFAGRRAGALRRGSAFLFIFGILGIGVMYTSVFAPNILLVNVKEMYTNDLADATTALEIYTQIMYFNKLGPLSGQDCSGGAQTMDSYSMKCKLSTMSRSQLQAFESQGFSFGVPIPKTISTIIPGSSNLKFCAQKVFEDNRDDGDPRNDLPESRYKVYCVLPPKFQQTVEDAAANGFASISNILKGNTSGTDVSSSVKDSFGQLFGNPGSSLKDLATAAATNSPIVSGAQLWLYSQLNTTAKEQVYSVFNPRSSFFNDERFKQRIKTRYNMTKSVDVSGKTEQAINCSFDSAVQKNDGALDTLSGQPNVTDGISLSSLSSPINILSSLGCGSSGGLSLSSVQGLASQLTGGGLSLEGMKGMIKQLPALVDLEASGNLLATNTYSYTDLMCSWYTIGKVTSNALVRAKASTAARYALQYLKVADAIKAGRAEEMPANVLASKLASSMTGDYNGGSVTDTLTYRAITYGDYLPTSMDALGKLLGDAVAIVAYNLAAYENVGTLAASWAQVIPNAAALNAVTGGSGALLPPPADIGGMDREYCLAGETLENKSKIKPGDSETTKCIEAINAMAPPGLQGALAGATATASETCPEPHYDEPHRTYEGQFAMLPSQKIVQATATPYIAGWFGINAMLIAAAEQQLYTSSIKGVPANYALFSGMGELLGDMAMSRGLMPSNVADMEAYLNLGEIVGTKKNQEDIARHNAQKNPFDPYNKFSFVGSLVNNLPKTTDNRAPLLATLNNMFSLVSGSFARIAQPTAANAFYHSQPSLLSGDTMVERQAGYLARLSSAFCPVNLQYYAIGITPDIMCNVRYSMPLDDMATAINLSGVLDYMTQSHSDVYNSKEQELQQRVAKADPEGNAQYLGIQLAMTEAVKNKSFIDKNTGKPTPGGEYEKYLQYCVNRLDPWGASAIYMRYDPLSATEKKKRLAYTDQNSGQVIVDRGDPYEVTPGMIPTMSVNATQSDLDWYTGKKCTRFTDQPEMLRYFRAYTTMCSVDGSMSGIVDCTEPDRSGAGYSNGFYLNNDILFTAY